MSAVVFDCDGLLVDTAAAWASAEREVVTAHGGTWTDAERHEVHGLGTAEAAGVLAAHARDGIDGATALEEMLAAYRRALDVAPPPLMPGATELLDDLAAVPLAVASNTPQPLLDAVLRAAGVADRFAAAIGPGTGVASKPDPGVYLAACAALGLPPAGCVALEDSPTGVTAGLRAGLEVIGVPQGQVLVGCQQVSSLRLLVGRFTAA